MIPIQRQCLWTLSGEMNFTYFGGHKVWDPETHSYTTESACWWNEPKEITVTNHSNSAIKAQLNFCIKKLKDLTECLMKVHFIGNSRRHCC